MFDFFIHFNDKTGDIVSVTNEEFDSDNAVIKAQYSEVEPFLSGTENFINYKISLKDKTKFKLVKRSQLTNYVSTGISIIPKNKSQSDLTVVQDLVNNQWVLTLSDYKKEEMEDLDLNFQLIFYVVLDYNLNKVVRKFIVNTIDLVEQPTVIVEFAHQSETTSNIVVLTDKFFKQYSMEINNEQN